MVDKTGTVTEGKPKLISCIAFHNYRDDQIIQIAAALEVGSEHSLELSIINVAKSRDLDIESVSNFESLSGFGVQGVFQNQQVFWVMII